MSRRPDFRERAQAIVLAVDLAVHIERETGPLNAEGKICCPLGTHSDSSPSFHVYRKGGRWRWHCFGCKAGGDVIDWVVIRQKVSKSRALEILEAEYGIAVASPPARQRSGRRTGRKPVKAPDASTGRIGVPAAAGEPATAGEPTPGREPNTAGSPASPVDAGQGAETATSNPGVDPVPSGSEVEPPKRRTPQEAPAWQGELTRIITAAYETLWLPDGAGALRWLMNRGLSKETIRRFKLGFLPRDEYTAAMPCLGDEEGQSTKAKFQRGITIPSVLPGETFERGCRWAGVRVRALAWKIGDPVPPDEKYRLVGGSEQGYLYPFPDLLPSERYRYMLVCEGELDALLAWQEIGHLFHVVSPGSASIRDLTSESRRVIRSASRAFLAFDWDHAGVTAAFDWKEKFPTARRALVPIGKDITDFYREGGNLREWGSSLIQKHQLVTSMTTNT